MNVGAFEYKKIKSSQFKIVSNTKNRPLLPPMKSRQMEIPGMHGVHDFGSNTYGNRKIPVHISYIGTDYNELKMRSREIAVWLTSTKYEPLVFEDEIDKYYLARIYDETLLNVFFCIGEADIIFECKPFAYKVTEDITSTIITTNGQKFNVSMTGTIETPEVIVLTNQGTSLSSFTLELESLKI